MKVLVVGDWLAEIYEESFYNAFKEHGCEVHKFSWIQYFKYYQYPNKFKVKKNFLLSLYYRLQNRFTCGPELISINRDLVRNCKSNNYDLVFIYRGTHIFPSSIKKLKKNGTKVFGYNNDDPFSSHYPRYLWRHFMRGLKEYDHVFSYRHKNLDDYKKLGYKSSSVLRSYYLKEKNFIMDDSNVKEDFKRDVVFIGHYENDGRDEVILHLLKSGIDLKLYGPEWEKSEHFKEIVSFTGVIRPLYSEYNEALNGAKVALVFLSKINNDTYTRRVFEVPAVKTVMLSEYTDDLSALYEESKEILFFSDGEHCLEILQGLLANSRRTQEIANRAYQRLIADGHEVYDRVTQILAMYESEK